MRLILIIFFFLFPILGFCQKYNTNNLAKNSIFIDCNYNPELDFYSVMYDRMLKPKGVWKIGVQTGLTLSSKVVDANNNFAKFFPIRSYFLFGYNSHYFETNFGVKILGVVFPEFGLGYRYKTEKGGLSFRVGYSGIMMIHGGLQNMVSLSVGYAF